VTVTHRLESGATLLVDAMADVRSLAIGFFVRAGSAAEPAPRRGLSHFLEHVLFRRTRRRSNAAIARVIDRLGGDVDAFTTKEHTGFYAHTLDTRFAEALDLLGDVVLAPAFQAADVETERAVILEEIGEANDNPEDLVHEMFVQSFWKGHPLGAPILGTEKTVRAMTRADLYRWHRANYTPRNLVVSVAGRIREPDVVAAVEKVFRRRQAASPPRRAFEGRPRGRSHVALASRRSLEQAHVCLGFDAPALTSPRRFAWQLLDVVLGGGMSSRLFQEVREKRGLAYSVGSSWSGYRQGGYESISAACAPKNLARLVDVTLGELRKLKRGGVRPQELSRAKAILTSGMLLALESTVSRMSWQVRQELLFGRVTPPEELRARVEAVTVDDIGEEAQRLFDGRTLSLCVVGNVGKLPVSWTFGRRRSLR
jgi:predicted Zn-dependent peptidase